MTKWVVLLVSAGIMGHSLCLEVHLPTSVERPSAIMNSIEELRTILEATNFDLVSAESLKDIIVDVALCLKKIPVGSADHKRSFEAVKTYLAAAVYSLAIQIASQFVDDKDVNRMAAAFDPVLATLQLAFNQDPDFISEIQKFADDAGRIFSYTAMVAELRFADKELGQVNKKNNELFAQIALLAQDLVARVPDALQRKKLEQMIGYRMYGSLLCLLAQYKDFKYKMAVS